MVSSIELNRARLALAHARMTVGEAWQDDLHKDIYEMEREMGFILARFLAVIEYQAWKRKHRFTWRFRTCRGGAW